ncbi:hypothetical protein E2320_014259, partial [Naja naja]
MSGIMKFGTLSWPCLHLLELQFFVVEDQQRLSFQRRWRMEDSGQEAAASLPKDKKEVAEKMYGKQSLEKNQLMGELENCSSLLCAHINLLLDTDDCQEKQVCSRCEKTVCDESGLCDC